jgi:hypothetical protein
MTIGINFGLYHLSYYCCWFQQKSQFRETATTLYVMPGQNVGQENKGKFSQKLQIDNILWKIFKRS